MAGAGAASAGAAYCLDQQARRSIFANIADPRSSRGTGVSPRASQLTRANRSNIGLGNGSRYYLFEQLLDQGGTRNGDAKLMGKLQTDLEILEKDRRRGSQGQLRPMIGDTALSATFTHHLFEDYAGQAGRATKTHPFGSGQHPVRVIARPEV
jgi:hypothetical protein